MTETHAKNHVLTPSNYRGHVFGLTEIEHFSIYSMHKTSPYYPFNIASSKVFIMEFKNYRSQGLRRARCPSDEVGVGRTPRIYRHRLDPS